MFRKGPQFELAGVAQAKPINRHATEAKNAQQEEKEVFDLLENPLEFDMTYQKIEVQFPSASSAITASFAMLDFI